MQIKNYEFITTGSDIIWSQKIGTVHFLLQTSIIMILLNIAYTLKYDLNVIILGQLQESDISYHSHSDSILK